MTRKLLFILHFFIMNNAFMNAQNRIELDFGVANTLHYKQPINLNYCDEGCFPNEQKARLAVNVGLSYYKSINQRNEIKIGIGASQYRYWEKGWLQMGHLIYTHTRVFKTLASPTFLLVISSNLKHTKN